MTIRQGYEPQEARKRVTRPNHKSENVFHMRFLRPNPRATESEGTLRGYFTIGSSMSSVGDSDGCHGLRINIAMLETVPTFSWLVAYPT